jgi:hypothetical protein
MTILLRLFVIIIGIATAYVIYSYFIKSYVLYPLCLINTNQCVRILYYKIENSILFNMEPTGYWGWYNNKNIYLYGITSDRLCENNFEPVYVIDASTPTGVPKGYECIQKLETVQKYYTDNSKKEYLYFRAEDPYKLTVYDVIQYLMNKKIIT